MVYRRMSAVNPPPLSLFRLLELFSADSAIAAAPGINASDAKGSFSSFVSALFGGMTISGKPAGNYVKLRAIW